MGKRRTHGDTGSVVYTPRCARTGSGDLQVLQRKRTREKRMPLPGRGEILDKKKSELQGVPVYKKCPRCQGRGYPRMKDTEVFKALGVTETTWRRNYKLFYDRLVEHCHVEESYAEKILQMVTR